MTRHPRSLAPSIAAWAAALALVIVPLAASSADADSPETTHDGLVLKQKGPHTRLWVRPGATLADYRKVEILDCPVAFRKNWERDQNEDREDLENRVTKQDMDRIRAELSKEFLVVFTKELQGKDGYTVIDAGKQASQGAAGVLLLRPAIIDLDIAAPDVMAPDMQTTFTASGVAMTLYLEMYDAATGQILARYVDAQREDDQGIMIANRVTNKADADEILEGWAKRLRQGLDQAHAKGKPETRGKPEKKGKK